MAATALIGSVQLVVLGVIGEYLGRLCDQSKGRPLFIVESVVNYATPSGPMPTPDASYPTIEPKAASNGSPARLGTIY